MTNQTDNQEIFYNDLNNEQIKILYEIGFYKENNICENNSDKLFLCSCGGNYKHISENQYYCVDCGYMTEKITFSQEWTNKKLFKDFPFRIKRNILEFNRSVDYEDMLNNEEIKFICFVIKHTREYLEELKRSKLFHFKYLLFIILDYMGKTNLIKYFTNISKRTNKKYRAMFIDIYPKLLNQYNECNIYKYELSTIA